MVWSMYTRPFEEEDEGQIGCFLTCASSAMMQEEKLIQQGATRKIDIQERRLLNVEGFIVYNT